MTLETVRNGDGVLFECISGSHAYGLNHPASDIDKRGVFIQPKEMFFSMKRLEQVADEKNDEVFYEIEKFVELLIKSNPTALEVLNTPKEHVIQKHPIFDLLNVSDFISKQCLKTFAGFAFSQIKKARGLNKKISNPMGKHRKSILEFCYVTHKHGSIPLLTFLEKNNLKQEHCGLVNIAHMKDLYALFYNEDINYKGIIRKELANEVSLSAIPKGEESVATLYFNQDGYSAYCKDYQQYWDWVEKRNESRYQKTKEHGKNYDSKNMMHTFRLLNMAEEIATTKGFSNIRTADKDFLWEIRNGNFEYDELLQMADNQINKMKLLFEKSTLPDFPNPKAANEILIKIRETFYS